MAVVSNVLIGKASGSVGNATFSTWKGINVLKEKAISVANPQTDKQVMRRSALAQVVAIFRQIPAACNLGFKKMAVKQSAYNAFESDALKNAFDFSGPPTAALVPASLLVSKGSITPTSQSAATRSIGAGFFSISYSSTVDGPGQSLTDSTIGVAYNSTQNSWGQSVSALRSAGLVNNVPIPAGSAIGDTILLYLGFYSNVDGTASDSTNSTAAAVS
jgi:hypothetical protein